MITDRFAGVEIRHLIALRAIAETRSFSRAAAQLGYAQSAVSQQIAALERAVGTRVVERPGGPRPVSLTEAGEVLAAHGERILTALGAARADLAALAAGETGHLRIGTFQSAGARVLPAVLQRYREERPDVRVELTVRGDPVELLELVGAGELDLTFGDFDDGEGVDGFERVELLEDPYVLLAPPDSRFAGRDRVDVHELEDEAVIGFVTCSSTAQRTAMLSNVVFRSDDNLTVQRLVGVGLGHAVVPQLAVEPSSEGGPALVLPLDSVSPRQVCLFWQGGRYRSPAACAFVDVAVDVCAAGRGALEACVPLG